MKNGYALLKACMEDDPATVNQLFAAEMSQRVGDAFENIQTNVGRVIGRGEAIDYDAVISEAEIGVPGEVPQTAQQAATLGAIADENEDGKADPILNTGVPGQARQGTPPVGTGAQ